MTKTLNEIDDDAAEIDGRSIAPDEVVNFLLGAAIAGHETTMNAAGTLCYELARDQAIQERVRADRSLVPALVEETLRLRAPVQNFFRVVTRDHEFHGHTLRAGDRIMLVFGAANHDPEVFPDPHSLSLDRENNRHLSFGWGIHRCVGANLAQSRVADDRRPAVGRQAVRPRRRRRVRAHGPRRSQAGFRSLPIRFRAVTT